MSHSRKPGTAHPPATLGEGCTSRYDPDALSEEDGTEFPGAAELWSRLQEGTPPGGPARAQERPAPEK
ncbi:hypothetical protein F3I62_04910 [Pseudomonas sp. R-28-1W-6]|jgi:hypothetical protein|uniref:hypothetical protein n=1 Tax=Pseudomonas sp. R-28-1W-6 TaxID=2650101 RepID=UPI00136523D3|nr:hypothetical protein [Pseudomonas sp. R-28-1W-6]MWV11430.1 hypothetical protein [Pseudomonas sp. R-28-1W-6]